MLEVDRFSTMAVDGEILVRYDQEKLRVRDFARCVETTLGDIEELVRWDHDQCMFYRNDVYSI